jgi:hypothetical protein
MIELIEMNPNHVDPAHSNRLELISQDEWQDVLVGAWNRGLTIIPMSWLSEASRSKIFDHPDCRRKQDEGL